MRVFFLILGLSFYSVVSNAQLSVTEQKIVSQVEKLVPQQIQLLADSVNINSGTLNVKGVKLVGDLINAELVKLGFTTRWIDMPVAMNRAGHLVATRRFGDGPVILLMGHLDTVFEIDSPFQTYSQQNEIATGPGVADMKGGNTIALYAVRALIEQVELKRGTIHFFFTGDEESAGKPISQSRKALIDLAKQSDYALNFETGHPEWSVIGRRGSSGWQLKVTAKRAHSSAIFNERVGAGAAFEMARILNRFYNEVRGDFGLTFNPGVVASGTFIEQGETLTSQTVSGKTNVVAQQAVAYGGLRFMNEKQKEAARDKMRLIVKDSLPQTSSEIIFTDSYPAMQETAANRLLLQQLNQVNTDLGLPVQKAFPPERRGAADVSFVAPYVTSIDGLGVYGIGAHSVNEKADLKSLHAVTQRVSILIYRLLNSSK
ncbi:M20/M25/M40 family metallo-hydrolase [Aliikangiella sp. IMCC44632]